MNVTITVDTSQVERELNRLHAGPDLHDLLRMDSVLTTQFQATQGHVHVITSSLKRSGRHDSRYREHTWRGEISYGGASGAVHDPVTYAEYEQSRGQRGGRDHDFMSPAYALGDDYAEAVLAFLRGEL